jgi:hypothetical protein
LTLLGTLYGQMTLQTLRGRSGRRGQRESDCDTHNRIAQDRLPTITLRAQNSTLPRRNCE